MGRPPGTIWDVLTTDEVHRFLWSRADGRHRIAGASAKIEQTYGAHYNGAAIFVRKLLDEGRMRRAGRNIYELVDPNVYDPEDPSTQVCRPSAPAWG